MQISTVGQIYQEESIHRKIICTFACIYTAIYEHIKFKFAIFFYFFTCEDIYSEWKTDSKL